MPRNAEVVFGKYVGGDLLLDSNLLLLYLVGTLQRSLILKFKRTAEFSLVDFDALISLVRRFRRILTTPHVLTEVNGLANSLPEQLKELWADHFGSYIGGFVEILESSGFIAGDPVFRRFGLTDAAIRLAAKNALVVTEDYRLSGFLTAQGVAVLNFRSLVSQ